MKVLHVFKTYLPDSFNGAERVIHEIAEGTAPLGVETTVLSLSDRPAGPTAIGHHVGYSTRRDMDFASTGFSRAFFPALKRLAARADIVNYHFPWPLMDLAHVAMRIATPAVVTYHSDVVKQRWLYQAYRPLMGRFLGQAARIVATSPNYADSSPVLQRYRDKVEIIPIGLDAGGLAAPDAARVAHWRQRLGDRFFLFVGVARYYKGLPFLLEAARLTGLPVAMAGPGTAEATTGAPANIHGLGEIDEADKAALLVACTALVLPSHLRSEAFGVALLEAAFAGRPMISCEIGTGTSFVNLDGVTGIVVPPRDPAALAGAMQRLWEETALAGRYGSAARERAHTLFGAAAMARAYVELYRAIAGR